MVDVMEVKKSITKRMTFSDDKKLLEFRSHSWHLISTIKEMLNDIGIIVDIREEGYDDKSTDIIVEERYER